MFTTKLPLKTESGIPFKLDFESLKLFEEELETFLQSEEFMNTRDFSKKVMFTHELKANNTVEGYNDSVSIIEKVIEDAKSIEDEERRNRIINLYKGYKYILKGEEIKEENVHKLYKILSKDLLNEYDINHMGELYREAPVYILHRGRLDDTMDEGIPYNKIKEYMDTYFNFVNDFEISNAQTDQFIKSQLMHFYFVYIHPYFDINGRSSRTIAMWYLLNNSSYPYIIFNRGINFDSKYDDIIHNCTKTHDITKFLKYMMINVKKELEKEYIVHNLHEQTSRHWHSIDYEMLNYFLSLSGNKTVLDYAKLYNKMNSKKRVKEFFETMVLPLIDDKTLTIERETKKYMFDEQQNLVLSLNKDKMKEIDTEKVKRLTL